MALGDTLKKYLPSVQRLPTGNIRFGFNKPAQTATTTQLPAPGQTQPPAPTTQNAAPPRPPVSTFQAPKPATSVIPPAAKAPAMSAAPTPPPTPPQAAPKPFTPSAPAAPGSSGDFTQGINLQKNLEDILLPRVSPLLDPKGYYGEAGVRAEIQKNPLGMIEYLPDGQAYKLQDGGTYIKQGKSWFPTQDTGNATSIPVTGQQINSTGAGIRPAQFAVGANQNVEQAQSAYNTELAGAKAADTGLPGGTPNPAAPNAQSQLSALQQAYLKSFDPSQGELDTQKQLEDIAKAGAAGMSEIREKVIPMRFITGQQRELEQRQADMAAPLQVQLANAQAQRELAQRKSEAELGFAEKAEATKRAETKPIELPGGRLVQYDPVTKSYKEVFAPPAAPEKPIEVSSGATLVDPATGKVIFQGKKNYPAGIVGEYQFYADQEAEAGRKPMDFNSYQNIDANRKARLAAAGSAAGLSSKDLNMVNVIADNARQNPTIKTFDAVKDSYQRIESAAGAGNGVGDLTLLRSFAKLTDPTTGVREEEYRSMQGAIGAVRALGVQVQQGWWNGQQLTPAGRQAFLSMATQLYNNQKEQYDQATQHYIQQAQTFIPKVDPNLIIPYTIAPNSSSGASSGGTAFKAPSGTTYNLPY